MVVADREQNARVIAPKDLVETEWVHKDYGLKIWVAGARTLSGNEPPVSYLVTIQGYQSPTFAEQGVLPSEWQVDLRRAELMDLLDYAERVQ